MPTKERENHSWHDSSRLRDRSTDNAREKLYIYYIKTWKRWRTGAAEEGEADRAGAEWGKGLMPGVALMGGGGVVYH